MEATITDLHNHCQVMSEFIAKNAKVNPWPWFIENVVEFTGRAKPSEQPDWVKTWRKAHRPKARMCYYNAQMLALNGTGTYYEGFIPVVSIPIDHAWFVTDCGKLIDHTLEESDSYLKRHNNIRDSTVLPYLGVAIPLDFIAKSILRKHRSEPLLIEYFITQIKETYRG